MTSAEDDSSSAYAGSYINDRFERFEIIQVYRATAEQAQQSLGTAQNEIQQLRAEISTCQKESADARVREEQARTAAEKELGSAKERVGRLETANDDLLRQIGEIRRSSRVAVVVAWIGTVLVGFGINIATGDKNQGLGVALILAGAAVGVAAFFVTPRG